jgi:hypothetical protein
MTKRKIAALAISSLLIGSPCLALTYPAPATPVNTSTQTKFADPDALLEASGSAMKDAYVQNNLAPTRSTIGFDQRSPSTSNGFGYGSSLWSSSSQDGYAPRVYSPMATSQLARPGH